MASAFASFGPLTQETVERVLYYYNYLRTEHPKKSALFLVCCAYWLYQRYGLRYKNVAQKVVLITGAGSGLGKNLAARFASRGACVVLWDVNEKAVEQAGHMIANNGGRVWTYSCDVTDRKQVYATAERVKADVGAVDILVNNAGIVSGDWIEQISEAKVERTFAVNVISHFWTIKAFLPDMIQRNSGHVVTIASAAGLGGTAKLTDYCASKYAAVGLDESLRREMSRRGFSGVKTTCVCPFYINTGMFDGVKTRFSWLLPILSENYASRKIEEAILTEQAQLIMPRLLYLNNLLRFVLPVPVLDSVTNFLGINDSMDDFKGRTANNSTSNTSSH